jgi:hypothetical protein
LTINHCKACDGSRRSRFNRESFDPPRRTQQTATLNRRGAPDEHREGAASCRFADAHRTPLITFYEQCQSQRGFPGILLPATVREQRRNATGAHDVVTTGAWEFSGEKGARMNPLMVMA